MRSFESSFGELGGCPVPPGATGNVATEDLVSMLHEMGYETGVDLERLLGCAREAQRVLGRPLGSHVLTAGPWTGAERESRSRGRQPMAAGGDRLRRRDAQQGVGRGGTYRTLDEQAGRLSEAEERFERRRRTVGPVPGAGGVRSSMLLIPFGLDADPAQPGRGPRAACSSRGSPRRSRSRCRGSSGVVLCVMLEVTPPPPEGDSPADEIFASFSNATVFLFIGSFIIAEAMLVHRLDRRLRLHGARRSRFVGGSTYRIILAFGLIGAVTSPFMSNTGAPP